MIRNWGELEIFFVSGREDKYKDITEQWLVGNYVPYDRIDMRKSGDYRKDSVVKREILQEIRKTHNVMFAIDDRKQVKEMWVSEGIFVFDVNQFDLIY